MAGEIELIKSIQIYDRRVNLSSRDDRDESNFLICLPLGNDHKRCYFMKLFDRFALRH